MKSRGLSQPYNPWFFSLKILLKTLLLLSYRKSVFSADIVLFIPEFFTCWNRKIIFIPKNYQEERDV